MTDRQIVAFDTETKLIGPGQSPPELVCVQWKAPGEETGLVAVADGPILRQVVEAILGCDVIIGHNVAFDMAVLMRAFPDLTPAIFQAYRDERVHCTRLRDKLGILSTTGSMDSRQTPDGGTEDIRYHMADLALRHLGIDLSAEKDDPDGWRLRYAELIDKPSSEWPAPAVSYAKQDGDITLAIWEAQERAYPNARGPRSMKTHEFQAQVDFALYLQTCWGLAIDQEAVEKLRIESEAKVCEDALPNLMDSGILRPEELPRPRKDKKNLGTAEPLVRAWLGREPQPNDYAQFQETLENQYGIRFTQGKKASIDTKILHTRIIHVCAKAGLPVQRTPKGSVKADADVQETLHGLDPALDEYIERQSLQKLLGTDLPALTGATCHPNYDALKATGRTSSFGARKGKTPVLPTTNIQQKQEEVRGCFVARSGKVLVSADYSAMELCTLAQKQIDLFKRSALADVINAGHDAHAWLGTDLALKLDESFADLCKAEFGDGYTKLQAYQFFKSLDGHADKKLAEFYNHYRTFAKPTGLGFPGGLGPATFITYAKSTYGVDLVKLTGSLEAAIELATQLREIWFNAYPESKMLFDWVTQECRDSYNESKTVTLEDGTEKEVKLYGYYDPAGMYRAGCTFTAAANGCSLQSPGARGAKMSVWWLANAAYDWTLEHPLINSRPVAFIHDENIVETDYDDGLHERAYAIADIMVEAMQTVVTDVAVKAEPVAMFRWSKKAKPRFDDNNRLITWDL